jgi:hypothetical protein
MAPSETEAHANSAALADVFLVIVSPTCVSVAGKRRHTNWIEILAIETVARTDRFKIAVGGGGARRAGQPDPSGFFPRPSPKHLLIERK